MKIAVFHNLPAGGAKRVVYEQIKYLSSKHEIYLYEYDSTSENFMDVRKFCRSIKQYSFDIDKKESRIFRDYKNFITLRFIGKKISGVIDLSGADVCLIHPDKFTQAPYVLSYLKTPSVYFCEELLRIAYEKELSFSEDVFILKKIYENITRKFRKHIDKTNAKNSDLVLVASKYIKDKIDHAYKKSAVVCPLGVDTQVFKVTKVKQKNQILFIGEKETITGYEFARKVLQTTDIVNGPKLKVVDFSAGKPKLTDGELAREYVSSIATMCTSYNEPFGLSAIESMACETPVLAVNEGSYNETVVDGLTGYLLPRDPKIFAEKIEFLIKNPKIARKMGKAGRKYVIKNFSWEKHGRCVEDVLTKLAMKKKK
ncbi:glycosyltransferase family 4 protein [Patescibacteria group bacterium]|nr:glycosyltransferase family 4 protein [Patescibacteria group bacterium]